MIVFLVVCYYGNLGRSFEGYLGHVIRLWIGFYGLYGIWMKLFFNFSILSKVLIQVILCKGRFLTLPLSFLAARSSHHHSGSLKYSIG